MEDSDQNIHLKNLSVHAAANEEEALNLLFLGDTNRMIAEVSTSKEYALLTLYLQVFKQWFRICFIWVLTEQQRKTYLFFFYFLFTDSHESSLNQVTLHIYNPRYLTRKWIGHNTEIQTPLGGFSRVFKLVIIHSKA